MSRSESRPPAGLKIVDAHLQLRPVGDGQLGQIGDHQAGAVGSDEFGAFLGRFQFLHHFGGAQHGHFGLSEVTVRPVTASGCSNCT